MRWSRQFAHITLPDLDRLRLTKQHRRIMAFGKAMNMMGKSKLKPEKYEGKEKPEPKGKVGGEAGDGPGDAKGMEHEPIHAHLKAMHEKTGNAHSHVEHHFDGHHTSHHISEHVEISGPHEAGSTDEVKGNMDSMLVMGDGMPAASGYAEVVNEPVQSMS